MGLTGFESIGLNGVEGVCLDLDDTLYAYEPCHQKSELLVLEQVRSFFNLPFEEAQTQLKFSKSEVKQLLGPTAASHNRLLYFARLIERLALKPIPELALTWEELYWSEFLENMVPHPLALNFIENCLIKEIPIALVTDLTLQIQLRKLLKLGLKEVFTYIISSEEAGYDKPHDSFVRLVLQRTGFKSKRHIWVGDSTDKDGASAIKADAGFYKINL